MREVYNFEPEFKDRLEQSHINHGQPFTVVKIGEGRKKMNAKDIMREHKDITSRLSRLEKVVRRNDK